jgi:hypothetical protein
VVASAQARPSSNDTPTSVELTGCVSLSPNATGQFAIVDAASGNAYRLSGKNIRKYAGQKVTVVGGPRNRRLSMRFGLWPSPNVAAQAGAIDPAQESIARQPGGAASGATDSKLPEFHVVRMRGVDGACQ